MVKLQKSCKFESTYIQNLRCYILYICICLWKTAKILNYVVEKLQKAKDDSNRGKTLTLLKNCSIKSAVKIF